MMQYESYVHLIRQLDDLVAMFEEHPDPATREQVFVLLSGLDALHREGLTRLVEGLRESGSQELLDRVSADPIVKVLLGLYSLADLDLPPEPEPANTPTHFIPLESVGVSRAPRARWVEVARAEELPPGAVRAVEAESISALLVAAEGEVYAYRNLCPDCRLPFETVQLKGVELRCSRDGRRYDARTGQGCDEREGRLEVIPVARRGSAIQLALQSSPYIAMEPRRGEASR